MNNFLDSIKNKTLTILEIGAGSDVPTIRQFGEWKFSYWKNRVTLIWINPVKEVAFDNFYSVNKENFNKDMQY